MKTIYRLLLVCFWMEIHAVFGQDTSLDLSTRSTGVPPVHQTISSAAQWMQNPTDLKLEIAVTNFYADTNQYMEIDLAGQKKIFYGAGMDNVGNYIPTNYAPVEVDAVLRRNYQMDIMCPNSGPNGSPLFSVYKNDFSSPDYFIWELTNAAPDPVSAFLWTNFTSGAKSILTDPASPDGLIQTNLIQEMDRIITGGSIYDSNRFAGVYLNEDTMSLLAQNPTGQNLILLNRLLLRDAYGFSTPNGVDNSGTAELTLFIQPPPELKISKTKPAPQYSVLINGVKQEIGSPFNLQHPTTGDVSTNTSIVEVLKDKFGHFGLGDGCDDATKAPGQGTWLSIGPGCNWDTNRISIQWSVSLGRTFDGLAAGQLAIRESALSRDTYTPLDIYYNASMTNLYNEMPLGTADSPFVPTNLYASVILVTTNVPYLETNSAGDIYTNSNDLLRQIKSCQTFVDILTPNTNQTVLNFYLPSQVGTNQNSTGLYTSITGSPFVSWTIQNPNPGSTSNLWIIENRNGISSTQSLVKVNSAGGVTWTLTQGSGTTTRVETRQVSFSGLPVTNRTEIDTVAYAGSGTPAYQCTEIYHFYPWGSELVETRIPNSPADLVTTYEYYDDQNEEFGYYGYGQIKDIIYPDGYWEKRIYEDLGDGILSSGFPGILDYVITPYLDAAGSESEATSPENANPYNSIFTKYIYCTDGYHLVWVPDNCGRYRDSVVVDGLHSMTPIGNLWETGQFPGNSGWGMGWGAEASGVESTDWTPYDDTDNALSLKGSLTFKYSDDAPIGLAGKNYQELSFGGSSGQTHYYEYYDHGIFDEMNNVFSLDANNHLFTLGGEATNHPDCRETKLIYGLSGPDSYATMEGHSLEFFLTPTVTRRDTRIFHGGSLVQTEEYIYISTGPTWGSLSKCRYYVDSLGRTTNAVRIDAATGQLRTLYTADYRGAGGFDGELLLSETDETGQTTIYTYDSLQRIHTAVVKGYGGQPDKTTTYTYDANGQITAQTTTAGSLSQSESFAFDLAGRLTNQVDQSGIDVRTSYSADNRTTTTTSPGGVTVIHEQYLDRRQKSLEGNGQVNEYDNYTRCYDPSPDHATSLWFPYGGVAAWPETIKHLGAAQSPRWQATGQDSSGFDALKIWPIGAGTTNVAKLDRIYWNGYLWQDEYSAGFPTKYYYYDYFGNTNAVQTGGDTFQDYADNGDGYFYSSYWFDYDFDDNSRVAVSVNSMIQINGAWYNATTNYTCPIDSDWDRTISSIHLGQLNGFTGNETACSIDYDADMNETITTTSIDRANNKITTVTSEPNTSSLAATTIYQNGLPISSSTLSVAAPTLYYFDALGRTNQIKSPLGFSTYMTYDPATGWMTSMTDPAGNTTSYSYYGVTEANSGKLKCQTDPNGKKTYYAYTTQGQLYRTWGDVPYPAEYHYSEYGELTNLITYRGGGGWNASTWPGSPGTGDNTYWIYDEASGALLKKIDAQGNATTYAYYPETGRLFTRSWQRTVGGVPVTVTNFYDTTYRDEGTGILHDDGQGFGDLAAQCYNDGTPNVYFNNYNRAAQPREIIDASGTNELAYDFASRLVCTTNVCGLLAGVAVSNHFNPYYGRDKLKVSGLSSAIEDDYGYDGYGRLATVGTGIYSAAYGYAADSDLLQTTTSYSNMTAILTTTRSWDYGFRLSGIVNSVNGSPVTSHAYTYDAVNRRTGATLEDGSYWNYAYNDRNELTNAQRDWFDSSAVSGQQYGYGYDNIGNRQSSSSGTGFQPVLYTANNLNQYTGITTPGLKDIIGAALSTNSVSVNGGTADRKGEYFHRQISVANTNQPVWQSVTNVAGTTTNKGGLVFPAHSQTLVYDADGNMSFDGVWTYKVDGENRLISQSMTNISGIANSNRLKLDFVYDYMGRRIQKIVSSWNGSSFAPQYTNRFVYDGWNLIATVNPQLIVQQSFVWGNDLSGTMTKAGGVGGLLMASISGTNCFVAYDGNGNVTALINAVDKSLAARLEYTPYGELLRETGLLAHQMPFGYSTKFRDEESELVYYGGRYYSPCLGKWIGRDPSWENDNLNLYGFVHNSPILTIDRNGLDAVAITLEAIDVARHIVEGAENIHFGLHGLGDPSFFNVLKGPLAAVAGGFSIYIDFAPLGMLHDDIASEIQEINFDENAQRIITNKLQQKTADDTFNGLVVGVIASAINSSGGNGDDFVLDASLEAAGTSGVDSAETIFGVATEVEDQ